MPHSSRDLSLVLIEKADADRATVAALLDNQEVPDNILGFHAQQCAEKLIKAVLTISEIAYPRTHDIPFLLDLLLENNLEPPIDRAAVVKLNPYAVDFRYEDPWSTDTFDRPLTMKLLDQLRDWAVSRVGE